MTIPVTEPVHRVYQTWREPPVAFVAEIGSCSSVREDEGPKVAIYQDRVRAREYYYADPPQGEQRLWRMGRERSGGDYEAVAPEANGRLRSEELGLEFALEGGEVRLYTPEGELLLNHVETDAAWREAEIQRAEEARLREDAEARVAGPSLVGG